MDICLFGRGCVRRIGYQYNEGSVCVCVRVCECVCVLVEVPMKADVEQGQQNSIDPFFVCVRVCGRVCVCVSVCQCVLGFSEYSEDMKMKQSCSLCFERAHVYRRIHMSSGL